MADLSDDDVAVFRHLGEPPISHPRGAIIRQEGAPTVGVYLLIDGWVSSAITLRSGQRQIQKLHLPGDMLGTPSMVLPTAADTLTALTETTTIFVDLDTMGRMFAAQPRLATLFLMAVQMERLTLIDALASAGHTTATENMAHLLLDLHRRLSALGWVRDDAFAFPVTQDVLGDLLGITAIHTNRILQEMSKRRLIRVEQRIMHLLDMNALRELSPLPMRKPLFEPSWLPR